MKRLNTKMFRVLFLTAVLSVGISKESHARRFFGSEIHWLGTQAAGDGMCQTFGMKRSYFFGILVSEEMVFSAASC